MQFPYSFWYAPQNNYFGNASDGTLTVAANTQWTPPTIFNAYDAAMIVKQTANFTLNAGCLLTPTQPCRGIFIYSQQDIIINGTLSMSGYGPFVNPLATAAATFTGTPTGASTSVTIVANNMGLNGNLISFTWNGSTSIATAIANWNTLNPLNPCYCTSGNTAQVPTSGTTTLSGGAGAGVPAGGLIIRRFAKGLMGSDVTKNRFVGAGLAIGTAENFQAAVAAGFVFTIPVVGGAGGIPSGVNGGTVTNGSGGGGCGGPFNAVGGSGAAGTCFTGGSAGGGSNTTGTPGNPGASFGGPGGEGTGGTGGGGPGNPNPPTPDTIGKGLGGLIILCAKRDLIIGPSGLITTAGTFGGDSSYGGGGGSGGGPFVGMYRRNFTNSGSYTTAGGTAGIGNSTAGTGGAGASIIQKIL